ncbi:MAG: hypothetical protein KatS3mg119_1301 [Rhodothalassiaceae bacterium]|nr:MAG: hypothetical protein KatS3mg119_1301 [Rhodothalassiaceae bacterium]
MHQSQPVPSLDERLRALRERHGDTLPLDQVGTLVGELLAGLKREDDDEHERIIREIRELVAFIERAKNEIVSMQPRTMAAARLPRAREQIDAVVSHTEQAASVIMDAAEELGEIAGSGDGDWAEKVQDISVRLFEASSFQDLTGQRLTKVMGVLDEVERRLAALAEAIGDDVVIDEEEAALDESGEVVNEKALTHGPQLDGQGHSQDEIDALLASFDDED